MSAIPPTLEDFNGWLSEIHDATRENISAATDRKAHGAHLDSFSRTRAALDLVAQFKAAHPASPVAGSPDIAASQQSDGLAAMDNDRQMLCLEAVWEVDAIARSLPTLIPNTPDDDLSAQFLVRALSGRMLRLTGVLMSALSEKSEATEDLAHIVMLDRGQG